MRVGETTARFGVDRYDRGIGWHFGVGIKTCALGFLRRCGHRRSTLRVPQGLSQIASARGLYC